MPRSGNGWCATPGRNPGDVWSLSASSYRGAHFSVYPEKLCIKPIPSSCPPLVCAKCGAPTREVVGSAHLAGAAFNIGVRDAQKRIQAKKWGDRFTASALEVNGYRESFYQTRQRGRTIAGGCSCKAGVQPGVVLDSFTGSGTTMRVALDLGRSAIGIDINPDYVALAGC